MHVLYCYIQLSSSKPGPKSILPFSVFPGRSTGREPRSSFFSFYFHTLVRHTGHLSSLPFLADAADGFSRKGSFFFGNLSTSSKSEVGAKWGSETLHTEAVSEKMGSETQGYIFRYPFRVDCRAKNRALFQFFLGHILYFALLFCETASEKSVHFLKTRPKV